MAIITISSKSIDYISYTSLMWSHIWLLLKMLFIVFGIQIVVILSTTTTDGHPVKIRINNGNIIKINSHTNCLIIVDFDLCVNGLKDEILKILTNDITQLVLPSENMVDVLTLDAGRITQLDKPIWTSFDIIEISEVVSNVVKHSL